VIGPFEYLRPRSLENACDLLVEYAGRASILAGGTDLLVELRNRVRSPALLIDIKRLEPLWRLEAAPTGAAILGAAVPLNVVAENANLRGRFPGLAQAATSIATYQLRNRATVVGNLCHASPAADMAPILLVLGADLLVQGTAGTRTLPVSELFTGVKRTSLAPDELVVEVRIPAKASTLRTAFVKQQRVRGHDLAVVNAAGSLDPEDGRLRVAIGSCAPTPILLDPIDVRGASRNALIERLADVARKATSPISDVRASAEYRRSVLCALLERLIAELMPSEGGA
jgi:CO/xanthine dehydrogenase FAD-binding subunit